MLLSIFWHGTPVHDGAVIVQGNQVVEVAAILPLSKRSDLPSYFGTRHRAAVGLAELTDALVIVVSEERGRVTVFKDESITHIKDNIELERVLREHAGESIGMGGVKKQTLELVVAAMICLAGITGIWFNFARGFETLITLDVPVEFINHDPKMEIYSASASSVKLQLSGSGSLIKSLQPDQVKVKLNLTHAVPGSNLVPISRNNISLPPGIHLKQVEPQAMKVNVDIPVRKTLPVQADWSGRLAAGLIMEDAEVDPDKVDVVGASRMLRHIQTIYTEKIPLGPIRKSGTAKVGLVLPYSSMKLADGDRNQVEVLYTVRKR
jgi:YbbR domain-containing protein